MLSTLSSSSSPYSHNRNNPPFNFYQKPFTISKSSSNTQLNKVDKFARKHSSSYALNYYDGNSVEMPKSDDSHGLKCHHMSTINLAKVNPQIFKNNKPNEACNKNNHTDIQSSSKQQTTLQQKHRESNIESPNFISTNKYAEFGISKKIKYFFSCSRPCGFLTTFVGAFLLISSSIWFYLLINKTLCSFTKNCSNAVLKILMLSALVCSFFVLFFGIVIIIYVKKDETTQVIVMPKSKYYSTDRHQSRSATDKKSKKIDSHEKVPLKRKESEIDMNEYNYEANETIYNCTSEQAGPAVSKSGIIISINDVEVKRDSFLYKS